jgi:hypothetical protein
MKQSRRWRYRLKAEFGCRDVTGDGAELVSEAGVTLTWRSRVNDTYRVQYKSALHMTWFDVPGDTLATHTTTTRFHALPPDSQRFYRVIALQ